MGNNSSSDSFQIFPRLAHKVTEFPGLFKEQHLLTLESISSSQIMGFKENSYKNIIINWRGTFAEVIQVLIIKNQEGILNNRYIHHCNSKRRSWICGFCRHAWACMNLNEGNLVNRGYNVWFQASFHHHNQEVEGFTDWNEKDRRLLHLQKFAPCMSYFSFSDQLAFTTTSFLD